MTFKQQLIAWIAIVFYRTLSWTWRVSVQESSEMSQCLQEGRGFIMAHWHGDELALFHLVPRYQLATMTSTSKDGQLVDRLIRSLGGVTSKGSSTRGGVSALKGLLRLMKKGHPTSMAVDGPKGPIHQVKPGVFELSRLGHTPIFPVGVAVDRLYRFEKSWNKTFLPMPFARVVIVFGPSIDPVRRDQDPRSLELRTNLETALTNVGQQASKPLLKKRSD